MKSVIMLLALGVIQTLAAAAVISRDGFGGNGNKMMKSVDDLSLGE